jgi:hypothetical protein
MGTFESPAPRIRNHTRWGMSGAGYARGACEMAKWLERSWRASLRQVTFHLNNVRG